MNKTVFITGGSSGIGKACIEKFYEAGYNISNLSRDLERQREMAEELGLDPSRVLLNKGSVTDEEEVEQAVENTVEQFEKIDVLVNNAGVGRFGAVEDLSKEDFETLYDVNVFGVFVTTKKILNHMKKRDEGQIIMISSMAGKNHFKGGSAYAGTKWALEGMTGCIQKELRPTQIKIGRILPGSVDTPFFKKAETEPNRERCLEPVDVAKQVYNMAEQGENSDIDEIVVRPAYTPDE